MAAYELYCGGYSKVSVLKGGMSEWRKSERCDFLPQKNYGFQSLDATH